MVLFIAACCLWLGFYFTIAINHSNRLFTFTWDNFQLASFLIQLFTLLIFAAFIGYEAVVFKQAMDGRIDNAFVIAELPVIGMVTWIIIYYSTRKY